MTEATEAGQPTTAEINISINNLSLPPGMTPEMVKAILAKNLIDACAEIGAPLLTEPNIDVTLSDAQTLTGQVKDQPVEDTLMLLDHDAHHASLVVIEGSASGDALAQKNNAQRRMVIDITIDKGSVTADVRFCEKASPEAETLQHNRAQLIAQYDGHVAARSLNSDQFPVKDLSQDTAPAAEGPSAGH